MSVTSCGRPFFDETPGFKRLFVLSRVTITLWCVATTCEYRAVAHLFGVARSTVCEIVKETCQGIVSSLMQLYVPFPTSDAVF